MKKKKTKKLIVILSICLVVLCILMILFVPKETELYDDGGTKVYCATLYKLVLWNKYYAEDGSDELKTYTGTSIFWYPECEHNIDELWEMECAK